MESKPKVEEPNSLTEAETTEFKEYVRSFQRPPAAWSARYWIKSNFEKTIEEPVIKALIEDAMSEIFSKRYEVHTAYPSPPRIAPC
jgi:hypothetical protein